MLYRKVSLTLSLSVAVLCATPAVAAKQQQSLKAIEQSVEQYLTTLVSSGQNDYSISLSPLDPRLRLQACDTPLSVSSHERVNRGGSSFVRVRCESPKVWQIYVQAKVQVWRDVAIATQPIRRGQVIEKAAVKYARKRVAGLNSALTPSPETLFGMESKQFIRAGQIIAPHHVVPPTLVRRNQHVVLTIKVGGISVRMDGKALNNARAGEWLRVANNSSGKVVEGMVDESGNVVIGRRDNVR